ncbi:TANK-binding kinase 1-binding protein 1-like [Heteronotia binoei]|uniref:TANK-binding kinase 1-binding protein 1-like n=1 Tax=Heteronotia binoei TaxID=13085 RepID=UPI00292F46DA|nr:TANK-binding kinase 1-binding protein 1-like [Heteronotia binoei]
MCSASHFALITAYDDIKNRLTGLERENACLKRKLKMYEIKFPLISEFGDERIFSVYDSKETSLLKSEKANLQQQLNQFQRELQKSKEREEQLAEMIQAYEKLCVEKTDLESELGQMRALVETHLNRIHSLEQQLRQRDSNAFQSMSSPLQTQEVQYLSLHGGHVLDRSMNWQNPRGLEQPEGLEVHRLEAELEDTRQEVQNSQHREEQLKAECERLQAEVKQLHETRAQDLATSQSERDMAWVKKVGDDQYLGTRFLDSDSYLTPIRCGFSKECVEMAIASVTVIPHLKYNSSYECVGKTTVAYRETLHEKFPIIFKEMLSLSPNPVVFKCPNLGPAEQEFVEIHVYEKKSYEIMLHHWSHCYYDITGIKTNKPRELEKEREAIDEL